MFKALRSISQVPQNHKNYLVILSISIPLNLTLHTWVCVSLGGEEVGGVLFSFLIA